MSVSVEQRRRGTCANAGAALALSVCWLAAAPAGAQTAASASEPAGPVQPAPVSAPDAPAPVVSNTPPAALAPAANAAAPAPQSQTDILSRNTLSVLLDGRFVAASGERSFVDGGFGKTRFGGNAHGGYKARLIAAEADVIWMPRFTGSLSANVSAGWQRDHEHGFGLIEAFLNYLPQNRGKVSFSARAGLMWPEISLEHSTGGAWSVVNTITPSAINAWVGEEVKVVGVEGTLHVSLGEHELAATGGVFGFNDTSGTLLSFRGWALHDEKATAFSHFPLPPLNSFITNAQEHRTRSTIDLDKQPGYYVRLDWRPPWPFGVAVFYYDNRGDPEAFFETLQWGWRTRFWNVGVNADLGPNTKLLAQGMAGSTIMGFKPNGVYWVHTNFRSAYALITQTVGRFAISGRAEAFGTREHGSRMEPENSEDGWALTLAARTNVTNNLTAFAELLDVHSRRGTRLTLGGISPFQAQSVFQIALRYRL